MKKLKWIFVLLACVALAFGVVSCSEDDDDEGTSEVATFYSTTQSSLLKFSVLSDGTWTMTAIENAKAKNAHKTFKLYKGTISKISGDYTNGSFQIVRTHYGEFEQFAVETTWKEINSPSRKNMTIKNGEFTYNDSPVSIAFSSLVSSTSQSSLIATYTDKIISVSKQYYTIATISVYDDGTYFYESQLYNNNDGSKASTPNKMKGVFLKTAEKCDYTDGTFSNMVFQNTSTDGTEWRWFSSGGVNQTANRAKFSSGNTLTWNSSVFTKS